MFRNSSRRRQGKFFPSFILIRSICLTTSKFQNPNFKSKNFYEILGVERTATQKEIKKAFFKLSKEYHPDSNASDKSLHEKFVKINEAFGVLSKASSRATYDQTLSRPYAHPSSPPPPRPSPSTTRSNFGTRRPTPNESDWGTPHYDRTFFELLRRKIEHDRQRAKTSPMPNTFINPYLGPFSLVTFLVALGILIHLLKGRMVRFDDGQQFVRDPRSRNYQAYREWQRLSALKDAESIPMRERTKSKDDDEMTN